MEGADPHEYAAFLEQTFTHNQAAWQSAGIHVDDWAWESHDLAESFAYGKLRPKDPVEKPAPVHSCSDDNNVGERLLQIAKPVGDQQRGHQPAVHGEPAEQRRRRCMRIPAARRVLRIDGDREPPHQRGEEVRHHRRDDQDVEILAHGGRRSGARSRVGRLTLVGRLGGEEFVAVLPSTSAEAAVAAERVRTALAAASIVRGGQRVTATVSVGVSSGAPTTAAW